MDCLWFHGLSGFHLKKELVDQRGDAGVIQQQADESHLYRRIVNVYFENHELFLGGRLPRDWWAGGWVGGLVGLLVGCGRLVNEFRFS